MESTQNIHWIRHGRGVDPCCAKDGRQVEVKCIVEAYADGDHGRLPDLYAIDTSEDIDAVCAKGG